MRHYDFMCRSTIVIMIENPTDVYRMLSDVGGKYKLHEEGSSYHSGGDVLPRPKWER